MRFVERTQWRRLALIVAALLLGTLVFVSTVAVSMLTNKWVDLIGRYSNHPELIAQLETCCAAMAG